MDADELFELEYEDELEALAELENDCEEANYCGLTKKKRSLEFPESKFPSLQKDHVAVSKDPSALHESHRNDLDVSFVTPLEQSFDSSVENHQTASAIDTEPQTDSVGRCNRLPLGAYDQKDHPDQRKRSLLGELQTVVDDGVVSKKARTGENQVVNAQIGLPQNALEPSGLSSQTVPSVRSRVSRRIPPGDFVPVTGSDGRRLYISVKSESLIKHQVAQLSADRQHCHLLGTSLVALKEQMKHDQRTNIQLAEVQSSLDLNNMEVDSEADDTHDKLFVDRYAPKKYTDLLSDESTNRNLLRWLKLWDYSVFGIQTKAYIAKSMNAKTKKKETNFTYAKKQQPEAVDADLLDENNLPCQKVALISGPPGLGKTTLAHIVARHAGYNVVEMNASDDRSPEIFRQRIESATQMKAYLGSDPRPNCLIIDEIDGAPQPAINVLLSVIKNSDGTETTGGSKKKQSKSSLQRPIICICNDLYVPSLRQLRQHAFLIAFHPTPAPTLASRLLEVSRCEHIQTDLTALLALCEKADNDIRSCLNTLQFVKARRSELTLHNVQSLSLGQKDAHKTLFSLWQHVFTMPKPKRKRYINPHDRQHSGEQLEAVQNAADESNTTVAARFQQTLQQTIATGEDNRVQQGLFENYLEAKVKDPRLSLLTSAAEWFCYNDMLNQVVGHLQNYTLYRYLPFLPVTLHLLFASNHPHKIVYPHTPFEVQTRCTKSENLIQSLIADVAPSVRSHSTRNIIVMELLPLLLDIIQPTLRPVNTQLYNAREKQDLAHLVNVMIAYNLTYQQSRSADKQYIYCLEPSVDELARYPDIKPQRSLSYGAKQLITREIELEKLRRTESTFKRVNAVELVENVTAKNDSVPVPKPKDSSAPDILPNHRRQKLEPKAVAINEKPMVDFFGRKIVKEISEDQLQRDEPSNATADGDVWFRFKEGFTNAVRKTVRIQDLM